MSAVFGAVFGDRTLALAHPAALLLLLVVPVLAAVSRWSLADFGVAQLSWQTVVRALVLARKRDDGDILAQLRVPVLVTHGTMDRIILPAAGAHTAAQVPGARLSLYDGVGHSPFFEDPTRFNRELADLVRGAARVNGQ